MNMKKELIDFAFEAKNFNARMELEMRKEFKQYVEHIRVLTDDFEPAKLSKNHFCFDHHRNWRKLWSEYISDKCHDLIKKVEVKRAEEFYDHIPKMFPNDDVVMKRWIFKFAQEFDVEIGYSLSNYGEDGYARDARVYIKGKGKYSERRERLIEFLKGLEPQNTLAEYGIEVIDHNYYLHIVFVGDITVRIYRTVCGHKNSLFFHTPVEVFSQDLVYLHNILEHSDTILDIWLNNDK